MSHAGQARSITLQKMESSDEPNMVRRAESLFILEALPESHDAFGYPFSIILVSFTLNREITMIKSRDVWERRDKRPKQKITINYYNNKNE